MIEIIGDIWYFYEQGHWIAITTNGTVRTDGACVMGRGVAWQAKQRFPHLPFWLGKAIKETGNRPQCNQLLRVISFPVKHNYWEKANIQLIEDSCRWLIEGMKLLDLPSLCMVRPGCGNGGLDWAVVKPVLERCLDDRFVIVERAHDAGTSQSGSGPQLDEIAKSLKP